MFSITPYESISASRNFFFGGALRPKGSKFEAEDRERGWVIGELAPSSLASVTGGVPGYRKCILDSLRVQKTD